MLNKEELKRVINLTLANDCEDVHYVERCHSLLKEPRLFVQVANKWLSLVITNRLKQLIQDTTRLFSDLDRQDRKEIMSRLHYATVKQVTKFNKIQNHFNEKFDCHSSMTVKLKEWRQFIHSIDRPITPGELLEKLNDFRNKTIIDYEIIHYDYLERLNGWLEVVKNENKLDHIFNENHMKTPMWIDHTTTKD